MTNSQSTKRALLASVLSVVLCFAMLVGSTFAWFTDSVTSGRNKIVAGNLEVSLEYAVVGEDGSFKEWKDAQDASLFDKNALWEPGHTEVVYLKVENKGSLALKYMLGVNPDVEHVGINVNGEEFKLSDHLVFSVIDNKNAEEGLYTRQEARAAAGEEKGLKEYISSETALLEGEARCLALVVYMPEDVGNNANYKTGTTPPSIELSVRLAATQKDSEQDSFGSDYDKDAVYPFDVNGETVYLKQSENGLYENAKDPADTTKYVADQASLEAFRDLVNVKNSAIAKSDITLAADVTMDENWKPVGDGNTSRFSGTFDGGGHQVINMEAQNNRAYGNAFFGDLTSGAVIKNLTFTNALVRRYPYDYGGGNIYGVVAGYAYGNVTFENVHVKDSKVAGYGKVGALLGMAADPSGTTKLINCSVEDTTIFGAYNCGAFIGLAQNKVEIENCTTKNVTWTKYDPDTQYIDVDTTVSVEGESVPMKGTYWTYSFNGSQWAYAAWGNYYTDYSLGNCNPAVTMTHNGVEYGIADGFCH